MDVFGKHEWAITVDGVKTICPEEFAAFDDAITVAGYDLDRFAEEYTDDDLPDDLPVDQMLDAWDRLARAFNEKTRLKLEIGYIDYNCSCVDGCDHDNPIIGFFYIPNAMKMTPAAKKIKEYLWERSWFMSN